MLGVCIHGVGKKGSLWWSCEGLNCDETWWWEGSPSISKVVGAEMRRYISTSWWVLSVCPSVWGVICSGEFDIVVKESGQFPGKGRCELWASLSDIRNSWSLNCMKTWWRKSFATPATLMVFEHGVRVTPFIRPWSTTTIIELCLFKGGKSVIMSTDSCLKGSGKDEGIGVRGGQVGSWLTLFCWHTAHPEMKASAA